jgi:hypothetical protein
MKRLHCLLLFAIVIILSFPFHLLAQENNEREKEEQEQRENNRKEYNKIHDYSFQDDYLNPKNRAAFPLASSFSPDNNNRESKVQSTAFSNITFLGPQNCAGRTRAILVDKTDPNLIFAGQTSGGLFRSNDKGTTWTPVNDQTIGMNITCITQNPFNPNIIYYGTGEYKNSKIRSLGSGVYKSTDNGLTFSQLPVTNDTSFQLVYSVKHSLVDSNTLFVSTALNGLYKSTDGGASFQSVFNNAQAVSDIECFPDGKVMITSSYDGIYYSPTGDAGTFTKSTVGLPTSGFSRIEMAYCDSFPNFMYSVFSDSVQSYTSGITDVYKSSDGGITWAAVTTNPVNIGVYCFADYMLSIVIKPDDPDYVFCCGAQGAYTLNGGVTWTHIPYLKTDHHALVFDKFNTSLLFVGNDQGIYSFDVSVLPLQNGNYLNYTYATAQIWAGAYFPSGNNCLIGAQDNFFMKNSNDNPYYSHMNNYGIDGNFVHVNQQDSTVSYISRNDAVIFRSDDTNDSLPVYNYILNELDTDGNQVVDDDTWHINPVEMNYLDGTQVYIPTRDRIWRTTNSGDHWAPITNSFGSANQKPFALGLSNAVQPVIYAGGIKGCFIRLDNAYTAMPGQEVDLSASVPSNLVSKGKIVCLSVLPSDNTTLYATINDDDTVPKVWKITNGTSANPLWTDISGNLDKSLDVYWIEFDPDHSDSVLFVGTDYGLYSTVDAGTTWFRETAIPLITIFQMRLRRSDRKLFVFTFGRGTWLAELPTSGLGIETHLYNGDINVFPDPSYGEIKVDILKKDLLLNEINIADISGRVIRRIRYDSNAYLQTTTVDLSKESGGIYFIDIKTNTGETRKKVIKL